MDPSRYIDLYCERTVQGLWAEPLNLFSNLAFIVAAILAWLWKSDMEGDDRRLYGKMCLGVGVIGVGSMTFHSFATAWAQMADVLPIGLFVLALTMLIPLRGYRETGIRAFVPLLILLVVSLALGLMGLSSDVFNGSEMYFGPAICIGIFIGKYKSRVGSFELSIVFACCLFVLSLMFRTADMRICSVFPLGTHFLWHICNSCVLFLCLRHLGLLLSNKAAFAKNH